MDEQLSTFREISRVQHVGLGTQCFRWRVLSALTALRGFPTCIRVRSGCPVLSPGASSHSAPSTHTPITCQWFQLLLADIVGSAHAHMTLPPSRLCAWSHGCITRFQDFLLSSGSHLRYTYVR